MAKKKDIQQCEYYEICDARLHPHSSTDKPNMAAHLGFRCVYVLISWFILSYKIKLLSLIGYREIRNSVHRKER